MKAVGYVRVSTENQAKEGVSLVAQRVKSFFSLYVTTVHDDMLHKIYFIN